MYACAHVFYAHVQSYVAAGAVYTTLTLFYLPTCINDLAHCNSFCFDIGVLEIFE